jgi:CHAD domain-containing protein
MIEISAEDRDQLRALSQTAQVTESVRRRARIVLLYADGYRSSDVAQATGLSESRARRWRRAFVTQGMQMFPALSLEEMPESVPDQESPDAPVAPPRKTDLPGILPDDAEWEAAGKVIAFHWRAMRGWEAGARAGEDPFPLKKMRVSARRLRAALRVFGPALPGPDQARARKVAKGLKRVGRVLGQVRDEDVLLMELNKAMKKGGEAAKSTFEQLIAHRQAVRASHRQALLAQLDSKANAKLGKEIEKLIGGLNQAAPRAKDGLTAPHRIREMAALRIHLQMAGLRVVDLDEVRGADSEGLHSLRIRCKWARYTLEFHREVLGAAAGDVIESLKGIQDHLGAIEDATQASRRVGEFLKLKMDETFQADDAPFDPGVLGAYLSNLQKTRVALMKSFPDTWAAFVEQNMFRKVALAVAAL